MITSRRFSGMKTVSTNFLHNSTGSAIRRSDPREDISQGGGLKLSRTDWLNLSLEAYQQSYMSTKRRKHTSSSASFFSQNSKTGESMSNGSTRPTSLPCFRDCSSFKTGWLRRGTTANMSLGWKGRNTSTFSEMVWVDRTTRRPMDLKDGSRKGT